MLRGSAGDSPSGPLTSALRHRSRPGLPGSAAASPLPGSDSEGRVAESQRRTLPGPSRRSTAAPREPERATASPRGVGGSQRQPTAVAQLFP